MTDDITVVVPRMDLLDLRRSLVQTVTRTALGGIPYVTGLYRPDGRPWSMSQAMNAGRARVSTRKVLFAPADYALTPQQVAAASQALDAHPWLGVFGRVLQLGPRATRAVLTRRNLVGIPDDPLTQQTDRCIPCMAAWVDVVDDVGGWDERFAGRAPEDTAFRLKLHVLHGPPPPPVAPLAVELWGGTDRSADAGLLEHPLYRRYLAVANDPAALRDLIDEAA